MTQGGSTDGPGSASVFAADGIDAVVFDMDGVLVDSEELWDEIRQEMAREAGLPWPAEATRAMQGMSTPEWSDYLSTTVGLAGTPTDLAVAVIERLAGVYAQELPLIPGAVKAVRGLGAHWPLGLASSSPRRLIDAVLDAALLTASFTVTISTEEVSAGKPDPIVYRTAAQRLGVDPARTVAVEDSSNGLRAAAAAGMRVVAVPNPAFPPAADALALADATVPTVADVTPELIASLGR